MRRRVVFLVLALSLMVASVSVADIVCEQGHVFVYNGVWHCNPGAGVNGCLRCYDSIDVYEQYPEP